MTGMDDHRAWFDAAVATPTESRHVDVAGCDIHYRVWPGGDDRARRGLLFVHGSAAHSRWWDHIAPSFMEDHAVAALDLSGMGDSGRRPTYRIGDFAAEIAAVLDDVGYAGAGCPKPIVVAHSFGAFATAHLALARSGMLGGFVTVDAHLAVPDELRIPAHIPFTAAPRSYASLDEALTRFRLIPPQPNSAPHIQDYIARHSVRESADGWMWKFEGAQLSDDNVGKAMFLELGALLRNVSTPAALIHGECSALVTPAIARHIAACFPGDVPVVGIPAGHHHLMIDQPLALIAALRGLIAGWKLLNE